MKTRSLKILVLLGIAAIAAVLFTGCITRPGNIVVVKTTTLGFDVSADASSQVPHVRLGLIRNFYQVIPTSTNAVYAPSYAASVSADLRLTSQTGNEDFATGDAAGQVTSTNAANNTVAKIGAQAQKPPAVILSQPSQPKP